MLILYNSKSSTSNLNSCARQILIFLTSVHLVSLQRKLSDKIYEFTGELVRYDFTSHQQPGYTETGPRFKVSSARLEKWEIDLASPGLVV